MSQPLHVRPIAPLLASDLTPEWAARVRSALLEGCQRVGVGADASIQITDRYGHFLPLLLPGGGIHFASAAEAQLAVDALGVPQM